MRILASIVLVCLPFAAGAAFVPQPDEATKPAVLVTGASTGIGRNIAETLAADGYFVYAGARKQDDIDELSAIENIEGVRLDVTVQEDVDALVEKIESDGRKLHGLVNNAGVAVFGPLTQTTDRELDFLFGVNVYGVVRVTRAFAPMIIGNQGRIISIGSISGILSSPTLGVYSMSKHAIEAFTDSLAAQLADTGVHVAVVEPGNFKSRIRETTAVRTLAQMEAAGADIPEEERVRMQQLIEAERQMKEPDAVSEAVMHALFSDNPRRRYMVVPEQSEAERTIGKAVEELVQLNGGHEHSYTRDELVAMIDAAMAD